VAPPSGARKATQTAIGCHGPAMIAASCQKQTSEFEIGFEVGFSCQLLQLSRAS
jgi:hypothetical protein